MTSKPAAITAKEAAALVGIDVRKISAGIKSGVIPSIQLGPRSMVLRAPLLELFGITEDDA